MGVTSAEAPAAAAVLGGPSAPALGGAGGDSRGSVDAICPVPFERWDVDVDVPLGAGKVGVRFGGFMHDLDLFDVAAFSMSEVEASFTDPQQRLLLETAWEALQCAGSRVNAARAGVYVGIQQQEYSGMAGQSAVAFNPFMATGGAFSVAAGRLSFKHGLVSDASLVLGVNLTLSMMTYSLLSYAGMLTPDGRCKTLDASADGYTRGEACNALMLLEGVPAAGPAGAAVVGCAVNQDGRSSSLTAPNGPSQQAVIRAAIADSPGGPHRGQCAVGRGPGGPRPQQPAGSGGCEGHQRPRGGGRRHGGRLAGCGVSGAAGDGPVAARAGAEPSGGQRPGVGRGEPGGPGSGAGAAAGRAPGVYGASGGGVRCGSELLRLPRLQRPRPGGGDRGGVGQPRGERGVAAAAVLVHGGEPEPARGAGAAGAARRRCSAAGAAGRGVGRGSPLPVGARAAGRERERSAGGGQCGAEVVGPSGPRGGAGGSDSGAGPGGRGWSSGPAAGPGVRHGGSGGWHPLRPCSDAAAFASAA